MINLNKQLVLHLDELNNFSGYFNVVDDIVGPAIIIVGDKKPNSVGCFIQNITLECNGMSDGILIERLDNSHITNIKVRNPHNDGVIFESVRQSHISTIEVMGQRTFAGLPILIGTDQIGRDGSNALRFDQMKVYACNAADYIKITGTKFGTLDQVRNISIGQIFCHPTWNKLDYDFIDEMRTMLLFGKTDDITIQQFICTGPNNKIIYPISVTEPSRNIQIQSSVIRAIRGSASIGFDDKKLNYIWRKPNEENK